MGTALLRLAHPLPAGLFAVTTVAMAVAADRRPDFAVVLALGLGMLLYQAAIGATDDIVSAPGDRAARPWMPLARGAITTELAKRVAVLSALGGLAVSFPLPLVPWLLGVGGLLCGLLSSFGLRRTESGWLPLAAMFALAPAWALTAVDRWRAADWWLVAGAAAAGIAVHVAAALPEPRSAGSQAEARRVYGAAAGALGAGVSLCVVGLAMVAPFQAGAAAIAGVAAFFSAPRATRALGRGGLLGVIGMTAAIVAVVFASAAG